MDWNQLPLKTRLLLGAYRSYMLYGHKTMGMAAVIAGQIIYSKYIRKEMPRVGGEFWSRKPRRVTKKVFISTDRRQNKRIKAIERKLKAIELKLHDLPGAEAVITSTVAISLLTGMAQGDTSLTREGLRAALKSLQLKGWVRTNDAGSDQQYLRMLIIQDLFGASVAPVAYDGTNQETLSRSVLESNNFFALKRHENRRRYKIRLDRFYQLNIDKGSSKYMSTFKYYKQFKNPIMLDYTGTAATQDSSGKNAFYLMLLSNEATNGPFVRFESRIRFYD